MRSFLYLSELNIIIILNQRDPLRSLSSNFDRLLGFGETSRNAFLDVSCKLF